MTETMIDLPSVIATRDETDFLRGRFLWLCLFETIEAIIDTCYDASRRTGPLYAYPWIEKVCS